MSGTAVNALRVGTVDNRGTSTVFSSITMNSLKISNPQTYATTLSNLPSASQTGYTFNGFYTAASGGTQITTSTTMGASDVTYYGRWTANTYTVTLNNQSATTVGTTTYYYQYNTTKTVNGVTAYYYTDSALTTPLTNGTTITIPTKTGYTFGGYYTGTDGTGTQYVNSSGGTINNRYKVAGDITLYAKWTINSYTLTVNPNGGTWNSSTSNSTFTQNYGTTKSIAVPSATPYYTITYNGNSGTTPSATKAYRAFTGWTKSGSGSITATTPLATTTQTYTFGAGNGTLTAGYNSTANSTTTAKSSRSYTITYNTNSTGATSSATSGTVAYTMNGWYTATSGGTKRATNGGAYDPTKSETVYAQWSAGTTTLATITKSGSYCTWNTKSDGSGTNYVSGATGYTTSAAVTLYAKCIVKNYEISSGSSPYADTFANAISWSNAGATVKLLNSISDNSGGAIDRNLTFNTNGKTLTRTTQIKINSGKTVTLSGNGKITTTTSSSVKTVYNSGNLTINGPILAGTGTGATLYINSTGTTTFSNGTITNSASGYSSFYVDASSTGNVSITGGSITTTGTNAASAITCYGAVNLSISGVTVNAYYRALANYASCKTTITSGTFSASQMQTIRNWGQMAISGGTFTSGANSVIHNGSSDDATGLLFITGGTFSLTDSSNYTVIRNYSEQVWPTASTTGYIKCCTQADSIHMGGTATVSNTGAGKGVINSSSTRGFHTPASYTGYIYSKSNYAVQASSGNIQINGGTIYASSSSYYSSGTVTFGSGATKTTGSP